jgi:uncharacterized delta-60 repeat protein
MGKGSRPRPISGHAVALCAALVVGLLIAVPIALAKPGSVGRSFGSSGIVRAQLGPHYERPAFTKVVPQADGGLLATLENPGAPSSEDSLIHRYNPDGSLDPAFPAQRPPPSRLEATEADGKLLVSQAVGSQVAGGQDQLERLNPDGTLDPSFGSGGTSEAVPFAIEEIVPLPSGKILVAGDAFYEQQRDLSPVDQIAVARFGPEGKLDPSFGSAGVVKLRSSYGLVGETLKGLLPRQGEGVVVLVNSLSAEPNGGAFLAGLTAAGTLDPGYGGAGVVKLNGSIVGGHALPGGGALVAGSRRGAEFGCCNHESDFFLARYTTAGQPDPTFGSSEGTAVADFGGLDVAQAVLWESDGSVLLGGSTLAASADCRRFQLCTETPAVARFTPEGKLDPSFAAGGLLRLGSLSGLAEFATGRGAIALATRPGGGAFIAGGSGTAAFLVALGPGGGLDPSFASGGILTAQTPSASSTAVNAVAVDPANRILVGGNSDVGAAGTIGSGSVVSRYLPGGALDRSYGNGAGFVRVPNSAKAIAVEPDGSSLVLANEYETEALTRISAGGEIDTSFGEEGSTLLDPQHELNPSLNSIALLPGGGVLAAGGTRSGRIVVYRLGADGSLDPSFGDDGTLVLGFGKGRPCAVNQIALQPDGRILLAGHVGSPKGRSRSRSGPTLALVRLLPSGALDPSFGHHGRVIAGLGKKSDALGIAVQGGKILVAGWLRRTGHYSDLLLRYDPNGRLDRSFAKRGISRVPTQPPRGTGSYDEAAELLPSARRILVVTNNPGPPVLAYRRNGRRERPFARAAKVAPNRFTVPGPFPGPFGALQKGKLILAWSTASDTSLGPGWRSNLQRLPIR